MRLRLVAAGLSPFDAGSVGSWLHGTAAVAESFGSTPSISGTLNRPLNPSVYPASGVTATLKKNGVIVVSPNNPYTPASAPPRPAARSRFIA